MILGKMAEFVFVQERWLQSCSSPNVEFVNGRESPLNASVCELNCLRTEALVNQGTIFKTRRDFQTQLIFKPGLASYHRGWVSIFLGLSLNISEDLYLV